MSTLGGISGLRELVTLTFETVASLFQFSTEFLGYGLGGQRFTFESLGISLEH